MKKLILGVALSLSLSAPVLAEHSVSLSYLKVRQDLFNTISFSANAAQIGYNYFHSSGLGFKVTLARSTQTGDSLYKGTGEFYQNKINSLYQVQVLYRYSITEQLSAVIGYGITEYKSTWLVDGVAPHWSHGSDAGKGYSYGLQYKYSNKLRFEGYIEKPYDKFKDGKGREETYVASVGFSYSF